MTQTLPLSVDLVAYRGDSWSQEFRFLQGPDPVDLTGGSVESEARATTGKRTPLVVTITDATDGRIQLSLPASLLPGIYAYDIEVILAGETTTWVRGTLSLARDVTNELPGD